MKIATIGTGNIGGTLGTLWAAKGHQVLFGSRTPDSETVQALLKTAGHDAKTGTFQEAFAFGEVILLAVPGTSIEQTLATVGDSLRGKVLIDATNRFDGHSAGEAVIRLAKGARVVKAFNSVSSTMMANPIYDGVAASMLFAGDDPAAKQIVAELISELGFVPADLGGAAVIPALEAYVGGIWSSLAKQYGYQVAIRVLSR